MKLNIKPQIHVLIDVYVLACIHVSHIHVHACARYYTRRVSGPVALLSLNTRKLTPAGSRTAPTMGWGTTTQNKKAHLRDGRVYIVVRQSTAVSVPAVPPKRGRKRGNA